MPPAEAHSIASAASSAPSERSSSPDSSSKQLLVTDFWIASLSPGERQADSMDERCLWESDLLIIWRSLLSGHWASIAYLHPCNSATRSTAVSCCIELETSDMF